MTEQAAGLLGSPILVPESDKFLHNQRLGLVTKKPGVPWTNEFFFHVFNTQARSEGDSRQRVRREGAPYIANEDWRSRRCTSLLRSTSRSASSRRWQTLPRRNPTPRHLYERKLAALEALKKSLLHQAFTGEL